jgi:RNA polymerase-binding transcription factor DksA
MSALGPYVRVQVDESFLDKAFRQVELRLDKHEEWIRELQRLLGDKPDRSELKDLADRLTKEFDAKLSNIGDRMSALERRIDSSLQKMEDNFESRLMDMMNMLNMTTRQRLDDLEARIPNNAAQFGDVADRLQTLEQTVFTNGKKLHLTRESVQQIAISLGLFNNTAPKLDETLPEVLRESVTSVTNNIQNLFDQIRRLKDQLKTTELLSRRAGADSMPAGGDLDITAIRPYPPMVAHWRDPPDLPPIRQFLNVGEVVDYVYRLVPKLQAHLTAMQGKIVENAADLLGKVDKSLVEKMFEKFQTVIGEMRGRVDELKDAVEQTATREEINEMLEDILNSLSQEGQTAVGRVKCMACGRDIPQVAGALTELEAQRALGNAPNSMVYKIGAPAKVGVVYQTKEGFDSGIVESPRSVRPFKHATARTTTHSKTKVRH